MIVPSRRTVSTSRSEARRAIRPTSLTTRALSSPECSEVKNASGMPWMWAYSSRRSSAMTRSPTDAIRYDPP